MWKDLLSFKFDFCQAIVCVCVCVCVCVFLFNIAKLAFKKVMLHRGKENFDSCTKDIESQMFCLNIYWDF